MALGKVISLCSIYILITISSLAQVNRYMVFFKDKIGTSYRTTEPKEFLSPKAITRRINQGLSINEQDIPVNANYIQGVNETGARVFYQSKWFNAVLVQCDLSLRPSLEALTFVDHVEYVAPKEKLIPGPGRKYFNLHKKNSTTGIDKLNQLNLIGINFMHALGYKGEGMTIAVFDAGFQGVDTTLPFQHLITEGKINLALSHDFVYNTSNVFQYDDHGTQVLSVIAAEVPDAFTGGAPEANFQLYVTEDVSTEYRVEEYNWAFAAERADSAGVDIISSSLGYYDFDDASMNYSKTQMDGKTAVISKAAQWAADRGMVVVCSAGNEGNIASWRIITAPADAIDVIAVANVDSLSVRSSSSSIGPAADKRIKPDLAAMGTSVRVINKNGNMSRATGTSLSAPLITALVAGVWQRYPELSNRELIALLKQTASRADNPDNLIGYGIPNFKAVVNYQDRVQQTALFEVFPNPITDTVVVSPIDPDSISSCTIELIAFNGQLISKETTDFNWLNRFYEADLTTLAPGIYFIRVLYGKRRFVFKVVKV